MTIVSFEVALDSAQKRGAMGFSILNAARSTFSRQSQKGAEGRGVKYCTQNDATGTDRESRRYAAMDAKGFAAIGTVGNCSGLIDWFNCMQSLMIEGSVIS